MNGPLGTSAGLESALEAALRGGAPPAAPPAPDALVLDSAPPVPDSAPPPEGEPITPAPSEAPALDDFDFENPSPADEAGAEEEAATQAASPLDEVKEVLAKEGELSREEADKVRGAFLKTEHGRRMYAADQVRRELEKTPEEGGLGRMPTLEEIRQGEADRLGMAEMQADFEANPANWMANFFGHIDQQGNAVFRPGVENIVENLPDHLARVAPQLHSRMAAQAVSPYLQQVASEIAAMPQRTTQEAEAKLVAGRGLNLLEQKLLGRITRLPGFEYEDGSAPVPGSPNDPLAAERARFQAERDAFTRQQQMQAQHGQQAVYQSIVETQQTTLASDARAILKAGGLHKVYPERVFNRLAEDFAFQVRTTIEGDSRTARPPLNPAGLKTYQSQLSQAVAGRLDKTLPVAQYRRMSNEAMRRDAQNFLKDAIGDAGTRTASQHAAAKASAGQREAGTGASPQGAPPAAIPSTQRPMGMDVEDHLRNLIGGALGGPVRA